MTIGKEETNMVAMGLLIAALFIAGVNTYQLSTIGRVGGAATVTGNIIQNTPAAQQTVAFSVSPAGVPDIYGKELGVSFDDVSPANPQKADQTIQVLGALDDRIALTTLTTEQKARYINILYKLENGIACEYCCGARSVIFETGEAACGCAHSYAMRGLTKYLLTEHADEYTDAQILEEVGKWKTLFFPGILAQKAQVLQANGIELNYINIASNKYRGIEKQTGGTGSMVGGC